MNRTLIDQSLPTRMTREQTEQFAAWLESMARHVRWCLDLPTYHPQMTPATTFDWGSEHGQLARMWIANNVGGDFT